MTRYASGQDTEDRPVRNRGRCGLRLVLLLTIMWFTPELVWAHGGGPGLDYDACIRGAETDHFVHFAAYQPQYNPFAEYCGSLPRPGRALLVFDLIGVELPNLPVSIEVIEEGGVRRVSAPARRYRTGVIGLETDLPPGRYSAVVTVEEPGGRHQIVFPLSVGTWWSGLAGAVMVILLILVAAAAYCLSQVRALVTDGRRTLKKMPEIPRRFA